MPNPKVWGFWLAPGQKPSKFHHFANEPRPARWQVILYRNYWKAAHVAQIDDEEPGVPRDLEVTAANVIFKWITILLMGAFMIFISPKVLMRLGADSFGRLSQLCQQGDEWDMAVDSMVRNLSGYDAAAELVQRGALISEWSDAILVNGTYGNDGALMYPGQCTVEDAEAQLAECEQEHCIKVLWVVKVQCAPTWTCPTAQTSALAAYQTHEQLNANATARMPKFRQPTVSEPVQQAVTQTVDVVVDQVNWASLAYNIYALLFVVFPSPTVLYRPSLRSRLSGFAYLSKYAFVVIVVIVWNIVLTARLFSVSSLWLRFRADACMVDVGRLKQTVSTIENVCSELEYLRIEFARYEQVVVNNNAQAQLYSACYLDDWTVIDNPPLLANGELYPAQRRWDRENFGFLEGTNASVAATRFNWEGATDHFDTEIVSCNTTYLRTEANDPEALRAAGVEMNQSSNAWAVFQLCLLAAQIVLSVAAVRLVFHAMVLYRPWIYSSGLVDVHVCGDKPTLTEEDAKEIKAFIRDRNVLPFIFWFIIAALATAGVVRSVFF